MSDQVAQQVAHELATIMVEHLDTLPAREREKKIKAGQKIMKRLKGGFHERPFC